MLGDLLDDLHIGGGRQLGAAERARQQQAEEAAVDQGLDDRLGQLAAPLDLLRRRLELRTQTPCPLNVI